MTAMDLSRSIVRNTGIQVASMGDELGMMNIETGKYYLLDTIGASIWGMLEEPKSLDEIIQGLMEIYDVPEELCRQDTVAFLTEMVDKKIMEVK